MNPKKKSPEAKVPGLLAGKEGQLPQLILHLVPISWAKIDVYIYIYIHISILKTFRKEYCIIYIIYIQVQAVVKNYKCCNVTRKFQFGLFWSVLNLILESAAVKDSSFYHVFSPHLIKDQLHQEMSCAICCPASSNRLGCDGAIHLTQKNRGPDVFFMTPKKKTRSNNISSSFEKVQILDPQNDFSS